MDPDLLLSRHRFLFDAKFEALCRGPTSHRLLWLADMDSKIVALHLAEMGLLTPHFLFISWKTHQVHVFTMDSHDSS
jgi:hypothetical protein